MIGMRSDARCQPTRPSLATGPTTGGNTDWRSPDIDGHTSPRVRAEGLSTQERKELRALQGKKSHNSSWSARFLGQAAAGFTTESITPGEPGSHPPGGCPLLRCYESRSPLTPTGSLQTG